MYRHGKSNVLHLPPPLGSPTRSLGAHGAIKVSVRHLLSAPFILVRLLLPYNRLSATHVYRAGRAARPSNLCYTIAILSHPFLRKSHPDIASCTAEQLSAMKVEKQVPAPSSQASGKKLVGLRKYWACSLFKPARGTASAYCRGRFGAVRSPNIKTSFFSSLFLFSSHFHSFSANLFSFQSYRKVKKLRQSRR